MKQLLVKSWTGKMEPRDVEAYVASEVRQVNSSGLAEQADEIARRGAEALGRLVQVLADNGQLTPAQITYIAEGWQNDQVSDVFV